MKKSNFVALVLGTIGMMFFGLGMCMCLLPEWGMSSAGIVSGGIGILLFLITTIIWRKMEGKTPIKLTGKTIGTVLLSLAGALLLGVGMCLSMVFGNMILGIIIGFVGILLLLMLIPIIKGVTWEKEK